MNSFTVFILFLLTTNLFSDTNIDYQIQQIQNASPKDRIRLMNEFKKALRTMNHNTRIKAIKAIQAKQNIHNKQDSSKDIINNNSSENNFQQVQSISNQIGEVTHTTHNTGGF